MHSYRTAYGLNLGVKGRFDLDVGLATEASPDTTLAHLQQQFGNEQRFKRGAEVYPEGSPSKHWYRVVSGVVRSTRLLANGHRHIANFSFAGEYFGFELGRTHRLGAEAVTACTLYRFPLQSQRQLIEKFPQAAGQLWNMNLNELGLAQRQAVVVGRMTAPMRVASFLLDFSKRSQTAPFLDLPMSREDIGDYLGLTIETVCRVLSRFAELRLIAIPTPSHIEIIDAHELETITLNGFDPSLAHYGTRQTRDRRSSKASSAADR